MNDADFALLEKQFQKEFAVPSANQQSLDLMNDRISRLETRLASIEEALFMIRDDRDLDDDDDMLDPPF